MSAPDLVVAGAGMAGLCAAFRAKELGARAKVLERAPRPGGSMALSSGVIWRHRDFSDFRADCPGGDERLQRAVFENLDADLDWLETVGAPVVARETGNPRTTGIRFDPPGLTAALSAGVEIEFETELSEDDFEVPVILATGGFQANKNLVREHVTQEADALMLRSNPCSDGVGIATGIRAGGSYSDGLDQFFGRNMPATEAAIAPGDFVVAAQLYARHATVSNKDGDIYEAQTWSENDVAQWTAQQPGARAWFRVEDAKLGERVGARTVGEMIEQAVRVGAPVVRGDGWTTVETVAGITTTLGGLQIDEHARVCEGVFAAGADVGGIATGGYSSGLAAALVFGKRAAESALGVG